MALDIGNWFIRSPNRGEASNTNAGEGEHSNSDFYNILNGISGIAGDAARTVNSLTRDDEGNKVATVDPKKAEKQKTILIGAGLAVLAVVLFLVLKRR